MFILKKLSFPKGLNGVFKGTFNKFQKVSMGVQGFQEGFLTNLLRATCRLRSLHWAWYSSSCFEGTKGNRTCLRMSKTNLLRLPTSCSSQERAAWNTWYSESTWRSSEGSRFRSSSLGRSENSSSVLTCKNLKIYIYKVRMSKKSNSQHHIPT